MQRRTRSKGLGADGARQKGVGRNTSGMAKPAIGVREWFRPGEHDRVEPVVADLKRVDLPSRGGRPALITGGAGFIGTNLAHRLLCHGLPVVLFDTLSRRGVARNLRWLRCIHGRRAKVAVADVRPPRARSRPAACAG